MKNKLLGYCLCMIGSTGYYGYYIKTKSFLVVWGILFVLGIVIIAYNNNSYYKSTKSKKIFGDPLFVLGTCLIPMIPAPYGLSILLMIILGSLYAVNMKRIQK